MKKLSGLFTAIITPFDREDHLDLEGLEQNIHYQLEADIDGILVLGSTGESPCLTDEEKSRVIKIARQITQNRVPLIVGTGSYSTRQTILNTHQAKELGADIAMVVTPYYNKPTQEGLYQHFHALSKAVDIPILLYNIPGRCITNIAVETMLRLAEIPNLIGVKESSNNLSYLSDMIEKISRKKQDYAVLSGDDAWALPCLSLGGDGLISVASNLIPYEMKALVEACKRGNYVEAQKLHYQLQPLLRALFAETNPIPIKAAMNLIGMAAGKCRLPLCEPLSETIQLLKATLSTFQQSFAEALRG